MPNTIAENLARLQAAKTAIANAITAKGGTVGSGDGLEEFPTDISTISTGVDPEPINAVLEESNGDLETALGGGSSPVVAKGTVNFYDYDGTIVKSMSSAQFRSLESMPDNPTHEGLISQGWNWDLSAAKTYVAEYGSLNIGQQYITSDGKTRIYITLTEGRISPILQLYLNANSELDIDWGDGAHSTFTTTNADYKSERHNYATDGDYVIAITVTTGSFILQSSSIAVSTILWNGNNNANSPDIAYNNSIQKIEIGTGVTTIGPFSFQYCYSLSSITIPNTVTSIGGTYAFNGCYSLQSITIPDSVTTIGTYAFYQCYSLQSITIPNGVTSIGNYTFSRCSSLSSITIPNTVISIGNYAFYGCSSLSSITIPDGVTTISGGAFYQCYSLQSITIPNGVTSIGNYAFSGCQVLSSVTIPNTVTSIGGNAFEYCYSLSSITIPDGVTSIGNSAFSLCYSLSSITIGNSVTSIGDNAFNGCSHMESIKFAPTTPPTVSSSSAWTGVPTSCIIYVPALVANKYMNGTNYPSKSTYTYIGYATYESGITLPDKTTDETYTLTWYANVEDAKAGTNPITTGNGSEVYAIATVI